MNVSKETLEAVRAWPGVTSAQVIELIQPKNKHSVHAALSTLQARHIIRGDEGRPRKYFMNDEPIVTRKPVPVFKETTDRIKELMDLVAELSAFKVDAIARYPDLGVPEIVLRARKIAALHLEGDNRDAVLKGQRDNSAIIKSIVDALEGRE